MNETNHSTNPCLETMSLNMVSSMSKMFLSNLGWQLTGLPVHKTSLTVFNCQLVVASLDHFRSANNYLGPGKYYFG